jgi:hypothetical protein
MVEVSLRGVGMANFMDVHSGFFGVTAEQLKEAHERDVAIEHEEGVHFAHAWLDPDSGKVFCLSSGPSRESVMRIHADPCCQLASRGRECFALSLRQTSLSNRKEN